MHASTRMSIAVGLLLTVTVAAVAQSVQQLRYGEVVSMEPTIVKVRTSGSGAQVGSTIGSIAGYALADRRDRWLGGLIGGALGGAAGGAAQRSASKKKGWQLIVRLEDSGQEIGVQVVGKKKQHDVGDRVRLMTGPGGQTQVSPAPK